MRVLIFSMPRCGTSILSARIQDTFNIKNLNEPFNDPQLGFNPASDSYNTNLVPSAWLNDRESFVVKLLAINLSYVSLSALVNDVKFTDILVINRDNRVDCCISLLFAEHTGRYHYPEAPQVLPKFECKKLDVERWCNQYRQFKSGQRWLEATQIAVNDLTYEDLLQGKEMQLSGGVVSVPPGTKNSYMEATNFNYGEICTNYAEVSEWIKEWTS